MKSHLGWGRGKNIPSGFQVALSCLIMELPWQFKGGIFSFYFGDGIRFCITNPAFLFFCQPPPTTGFPTIEGKQWPVFTYEQPAELRARQASWDGS